MLTIGWKLAKGWVELSLAAEPFPVFASNISPLAARAELCFHKCLWMLEGSFTPLLHFNLQHVHFGYFLLFSPGISCIFTDFGSSCRSASAVLVFHFDKWAKHLELNYRIITPDGIEFFVASKPQSLRKILTCEWEHNSRLNEIKIDKRPSGCWGSVLDFFCVNATSSFIPWSSFVPGTTCMHQIDPLPFCFYQKSYLLRRYGFFRFSFSSVVGVLWAASYSFATRIVVVWTCQSK